MVGHTGKIPILDLILNNMKRRNATKTALKNVSGTEW
jgi:hypothetical protein